MVPEAVALPLMESPVSAARLIDQVVMLLVMHTRKLSAQRLQVVADVELAMNVRAVNVHPYSINLATVTEAVAVVGPVLTVEMMEFVEQLEVARPARP